MMRRNIKTTTHKMAMTLVLRAFCYLFERQVNGPKLSQRFSHQLGWGRFGTALLIFLLFPYWAQAQPATTVPPSCLGASNAADQQRCRDTFSRQATSSSRTTPLAGGWRLVKTADPRGGTDAVSIMHTSDTAKSDLGLAGLTFRCGQLGIETIIVVLEPLPHELRPQVSIKSGSNQKLFGATIIQGGEAVLLPAETAKILVSAEWQSAAELSVNIEIKPDPIQGTIPIAGLGNALQVLSQNCTMR
jgi:hypothetical protein